MKKAKAGLILVQDYIQEMKQQGYKDVEVAETLGISQSMVSTYKYNRFNPSIEVAKFLYKNKGIVLHPFSPDSLDYELSLEAKK